MADNYETSVSFGTTTPGRVQPPMVEVSTGQDEGHSLPDFDNFESLAAKLVQVPKTEIDEQRQRS